MGLRRTGAAAIVVSALAGCLVPPSALFDERNAHIDEIAPSIASGDPRHAPHSLFRILHEEWGAVVRVRVVAVSDDVVRRGILELTGVRRITGVVLDVVMHETTHNFASHLGVGDPLRAIWVDRPGRAERGERIEVGREYWFALRSGILGSDPSVVDLVELDADSIVAHDEGP